MTSNTEARTRADKPKGLRKVTDNWGLLTFVNQAGGRPPKRFQGKHTPSIQLQKDFDAYNAQVQVEEEDDTTEEE